MAEEKVRKYPLDENGLPDLADDEWDLPDDWPRPENDPNIIRPGEDLGERLRQEREEGQRRLREQERETAHSTQ